MGENWTGDLAVSPHERLRLIEERLIRIETYLNLPPEEVDSKPADADSGSADGSRADAFENSARTGLRKSELSSPALPAHLL
jgi:hypothetical protein